MSNKDSYRKYFPEDQPVQEAQEKKGIIKRILDFLFEPRCAEPPPPLPEPWWLTYVVAPIEIVAGFCFIGLTISIMLTCNTYIGDGNCVLGWKLFR